jgi:hypothetical protein
MAETTRTPVQLGEPPESFSFLIAAGIACRALPKYGLDPKDAS